MEFTENEKLVISLFDGKITYYNLETLKSWEKNGASLLDIVKAYGIMMKHCDKPSFNYMSKVLFNNLNCKIH